ncbi:MAG: hypothetical protein R3C20_17850 [Planctomycetaceae bacterium]
MKPPLRCGQVLEISFSLDLPAAQFHPGPSAVGVSASGLQDTFKMTHCLIQCVLQVAIDIVVQN